LQVAQELGMAPQSVEMRLILLSSTGMLQSNDAKEAEYQYLAEPTLDRFAQLIAEAYSQDRSALYVVVGSARRADPVRGFADAFDLRKP
jgi:hypothetical protein